VSPRPGRLRVLPPRARGQPVNEDRCAQGHLMLYHRVTNEPVCCQRCGKTIDQIEEEEQR
jgi:hypothetical protein